MAGNHGWELVGDGLKATSPLCPFSDTGDHQVTMAHLDSTRTLVMFDWAHNTYASYGNTWGPSYCIVVDHSDRNNVIFGNWTLMPAPTSGYGGWTNGLATVSSSRVLARAYEAYSTDEWLIIDVSGVSVTLSSILHTPTLPYMEYLYTTGGVEVYLPTTYDGVGHRLGNNRVGVAALGVDEYTVQSGQWDNADYTRRYWILCLNTDTWEFETSNIPLPLNPDYPLYPDAPGPLVYVPGHGTVVAWTIDASKPRSGLQVLAWTGSALVMGPEWHPSVLSSPGPQYTAYDDPVPFLHNDGTWKAMGSKAFYPSLTFSGQTITETGTPVVFTDYRAGVGDYERKVVVPDAGVIGYSPYDGTFRIDTDQANTRARLNFMYGAKSAGDGSEDYLHIIPGGTYYTQYTGLDKSRFFLYYSHEGPSCWFATYIFDGTFTRPVNLPVSCLIGWDVPNRGTRTIKFGDGTAPLTEVSSTTPPPQQYTYHTWLHAGTYTVSVKAIDDFGRVAFLNKTFTVGGTDVVDSDSAKAREYGRIPLQLGDTAKAVIFE